MVHRYNKDTQQKILKEAADLFMSKGVSWYFNKRDRTKSWDTPSPIFITILVIKKSYIQQY